MGKCYCVEKNIILDLDGWNSCRDCINGWTMNNCKTQTLINSVGTMDTQEEFDIEMEHLVRRHEREVKLKRILK